MDNKSLSHVRWKCQYHIVFIPKYRKKVLYGKLKADVRDIISTLCRYIRCRDYRWRSMRRSYTFKRSYSAQVEYFKFIGVLKRKEYANDI